MIRLLKYIFYLHAEKNRKLFCDMNFYECSNFIIVISRMHFLFEKQIILNIV